MTDGAPAACEAAATLYTAKGGQGCTTTAVAIAVLLGRTEPVALVAHNPADALSIAGRARVEGETSVPITNGASLVLDDQPPQSALVIRDAGPTLDKAVPSPPAGMAIYLVTRPCFLALRAALEHPVRPTGVIVVNEAGRAITADDVEAVINAPVVATIPVTSAISRTIDAGLLAADVPSAMARALEPLAGAVRVLPHRSNPMVPDTPATSPSRVPGRSW